MSHRYKEPRTCECGYTTIRRSAFCAHRKSCVRVRDIADVRIETELRERVQTLEQQLLAKDEQLKQQLHAKDEQLHQQLKAKDEQIAELLLAARDERKRPRVQNQTNNNRYNVNNQINIFGKESLEHITEAKLQELIADPDTSVARLVTLKHSVEQNRNVRIPNVRDKFVEILVERDGEKRWEALPKTHVLSELVEHTSLQLEAEADDATQVGRRFTQWHEKLLESQDQNGSMFRQQCDMVHKHLAQATRT